MLACWLRIARLHPHPERGGLTAPIFATGTQDDVYGFLEQRCLNTLVVALLTFSVRYNVGVGRSIACVGPQVPVRSPAGVPSMCLRYLLRTVYREESWPDG